MTQDEALQHARSYTDNLTEKLAATIFEGRNMADAAPRRGYEAVAEATGTFHIAWDDLTDEQRSAIGRSIRCDIERALKLGGIVAVVATLSDGLSGVDL